MQKLAVLHAGLEISLSGSTCSLMLCLPDCWECEICHSCTRSRQSVSPPAHARSSCAYPIAGTAKSIITARCFQPVKANAFPYFSQVRGYGGCAPMITQSPWPIAPWLPAVFGSAPSFRRFFISHLFRQGGMGAVPPWLEAALALSPFVWPEREAHVNEQPLIYRPITVHCLWLCSVYL